jgi:cell division protein FtsB
MDHDRLKALRRHHSGWRLLASPHAPMVVSFLDRAFLAGNERLLPESELINRLEDVLHGLRQTEGEDVYPRAARAYLTEWADDEHGWLRRFYVDGSDEAHFDLTPATEKAITWLKNLEQPQFVGAESRLLTVFELLRQIVERTETDPQARIDELERRKAELEAEIEAIRDGRLELMDDTRLRERFMQMVETARALLADFRQVEENFRQLDRQVRERITRFEGGKGEVLSDIFDEHDSIAGSDQGRSFRAFWDFLMSPARQEELTGLLERVLSLEPITELKPDRRLRRIHDDWLEAGAQTQRTVARLSEQLRRFLDDRAWLENRRIMDLIQGLEQQALAVRDDPPRREQLNLYLDASSPTIELPMDRPLYSPPIKPRIEQQELAEGDADIDPEALFNQVFVDRDRLRAGIRQALADREQVRLSELIAEHPLELGLAELVSYLAIADEDRHAVIDDTAEELVEWIDDQGVSRRARVPLVLYTRGA